MISTITIGQKPMNSPFQRLVAKLPLSAPSDHERPIADSALALLAMAQIVSLPSTAPTSWPIRYEGMKRLSTLPFTNSPALFAGFTWPPEMGPTEYARIMSEKPKPRATASAPAPPKEPGMAPSWRGRARRA